MPSKKHTPTKDEREHKGRVAKLGCLVCYRPAQVHHKTGAGWALRATDWHTMPLCPYHHTDGPHGECVHRGTPTFEGKYGTQDEMIARTFHKLAMIYPEYREGGRLYHHRVEVCGE